MAQLIVRNLEDDVRDRLRDRAREHGRSMEEEVRDILRAAAVEPATSGPAAGLGSQIAALFRDQPDLGDEPFDPQPLSGGPPTPPAFAE